MHVMVKNSHTPNLPDATDVAMCTCANLRKVTRAVTQAFDEALRPAGLRSTQFTLLAVLSAKGDAPLTRVAETLGMDRTTLTRNLKPLVQRGLISLEQGDDQRVRNVSLTDDGSQAFEDALPHWQLAQKRISGNLGHERWSGFLNDMSAAISAVESG